jgi:hypothetical protein
MDVNVWHLSKIAGDVCPREPLLVVVQRKRGSRFVYAVGLLVSSIVVMAVRSVISILAIGAGRTVHQTAIGIVTPRQRADEGVVTTAGRQRWMHLPEITAQSVVRNGALQAQRTEVDLSARVAATTMVAVAMAATVPATPIDIRGR